MIKTPGLYFEPTDEQGEVTIQQNIDKVFYIDVGLRETCTIKNIRMLF